MTNNQPHPSLPVSSPSHHHPFILPPLPPLPRVLRGCDKDVGGASPSHPGHRRRSGSFRGGPSPTSGLVGGTGRGGEGT